jgi:hypothetical protein
MLCSGLSSAAWLSKNTMLANYLLVTSDSERIPNALVAIRAKYVGPVTVEPSSITIGSDDIGDVEKQISIKTIVPSLLRLSVATFRCRLDAHSTGDKSLNHSVRITVPPPGARPMDEKIHLHLTLFPTLAAAKIFDVHLPVYRFLSRNEH